MIPSLALTAVAVLAIILLLLSGRDDECEERAARGQVRQQTPQDNVQPAGLVRRIFSLEDRDFIRGIQSRELQGLFLDERRKVALHWVRQTTGEVREIMKRHRLISRQSANLDAGAEVKLFFRYAEIRFLCGTLALLVRVFGPHVPVNLAAHTSEVYQRMGRSLPKVASVSPDNLAAS